MWFIDFSRQALSLFPVIAIFLACLSTGLDIRRAIGRTLIVWAALSLAFSEIAGLFDALTPAAALVFWLPVTAACLALSWRRFSAENLRDSLFVLDWKSSAGIWILVYALVLLAIALTSMPGTWDSQTYHLARIEHWIQDGSLAPYPTVIDRQIALGTLAESLILQLRLISGTDSLAALVQWLAFLGCLASASLIAGRLGADRRGQTLAALFVATIPMAILQSTSTQTDLVTAVFLILFVQNILDLFQDVALRRGLEAALAIALAVLTKATALIIGFPFGLWLLGWLWLSRKKIAGFKLIAAGAGIFLAVDFLFFWRNYQIFGSIFSNQGALTNNASFGVAQTIDNAILNSAMNLSTGIPAVDGFLTDTIERLCAFLGVTGHRADTMFMKHTFNLATGKAILHEDTASNLVHAVIILFSCGFVLFGALRNGRLKSAALYVACLVASFILFSAVVRWQPWITRLELPFFVLAGPIVGFALGSFAPRTLRGAVPALVLVMAVGSLPWLVANRSRPLLPKPYFLTSRTDNLFANRTDLKDKYVAVADRITAGNYRNIGLVIGRDDWEYPLWYLLNPYLSTVNGRIEHMMSGKTEVKSYPNGAFHPDVLFVFAKELPAQIEIDAVTWTRFLDEQPLGLYRSEPSQAG
jgi:hypothetical protein